MAFRHQSDVQSGRNPLTCQNMKLMIISFIACGFFYFAPIDCSFYLIKVADKPNSTDEQVLHNEPKVMDHGGEGGKTSLNEDKDVAQAEKTLALHAKLDDTMDAITRVSHSSFSQASLKKYPKNAVADAKIDYRSSFSRETDDDQEEEEMEEERHFEATGQLEGKTDGNESVSVILGGNDYGRKEATCKAELQVKSCRSRSKQQCGNGQKKCKKG